MVDVPKVVPWATWDEWREVRGLLYSPDPGCRQAGCGIAAAWRVRGKVPLSVETTAQLVEVALATSPPQIEQLALGMSVVRFVNGLIEPEQRKQYVEGEEEMTNVTLCAVMYACVCVCVCCVVPAVVRACDPCAGSSPSYPLPSSLPPSPHLSCFLRPSSPQVRDVYRGHRGADWVAAVAGGREARDDAYAAAVPCRPPPCRLTVPRLAQPQLLGK